VLANPQIISSIITRHLQERGRGTYDGDVCFRPGDEPFAADPSCETPDARGGVRLELELVVVGARVGQFFGLGSRFICGDGNGAAVAGATAVDMVV
jgi:hypothetical protein